MRRTTRERAQMSARKKAWLTPREQVEHLLSKGVKFERWSEEDAEDYLRENNSYFRLRSYRSNFAKRVGGERNGQYVNLDFAMLVDLSVIDMCLRNELLPLTLDIEHFSKMSLLGVIEANGENGYNIVKDFINLCARKDGSNPVVSEIERGLSSPYTRGLIKSHPDADYPVWEFFEVIPFGRFSHFVHFCGERFDDDTLLDKFYLLQSVKGLRNACAHNSCIINDMKAGGATHRARAAVTKGLGEIGVGKDARKTKLSNERFQQIATTLFLHSHIASSGVVEHRGIRLEELVRRMAKHSDYYEPGSLVLTGFAFIESMVDGWYLRANGEAERRLV